MPYQLGHDLTCCRYDGHFIFLDMRLDRYFRLPEAVECAFAAYVDTGDETVIAPLVEKGLLVHVPANPSGVRTIHSEPLARSALEQAGCAGKPSVATRISVLAIVARTQWQLATRGLDDVLDGLSTYRNLRAPSAPGTLTRLQALRFVRAAQAFNLARVYVPIAPRCLPDAISMVAFLARRGLHAKVVFGVAGNPFAAHAWVQVADMVLSDSVGNATAHTPIRVV